MLGKKEKEYFERLTALCYLNDTVANILFIIAVLSSLLKYSLVFSYCKLYTIFLPPLIIEIFVRIFPLSFDITAVAASLPPIKVGRNDSSTPVSGVCLKTSFAKFTRSLLELACLGITSTHIKIISSVGSPLPNKFEGKNEDPLLLEKLTSSQEVYGIFNILMKALRAIMQKNRIYLNAKTIKERRLQHDRAFNPVKAFVDEAISEESVEIDFTLKEDMYRAFRKYIRKYTLASESKEAFGKDLMNLKLEECKRTIGEKRYTYWRGIRLKPEYICPNKQQMVTRWALLSTQ